MREIIFIDIIIITTTRDSEWLARITLKELP